ncbi:Polysaccharide biosynthesis protein [compost metagenome]
MQSHRLLFSNASALLIIQIANYILPFLLIPYLTRTLGLSVYGIIAFGLTIVQIACIITDYGFSLSATYQIAKHSGDSIALRKIAGAVMTCKALLLIPVIVLASAFLLLQDKYSEYHLYFLLLILPIIGQTFQPIWFFQGIERMGFITIYTALARTLYLLMVILWVSGPDDNYMVAVANGIANISAAVIGMGLMYRLGYWPEWCGWNYVRQTFKDSTEYFWSRAAVATYTAGGAFFLGLVSSPIQVAYYSAAEQLYKAAQSLITPISQALYPYMVKSRNIKLLLKIIKATVLISLSGLIFGILTGEFWLKTIFGAEYIASYSTLVLFMIIFTITAPSILLGYPMLGAFGGVRIANISVIIAGLIQAILLAACFLMKMTFATHIAATVLIVETIVLLIRIKKSRELITREIA